MTQQVSTGVAQDVQTFFVFGGDDGQEASASISSQASTSSPFTRPAMHALARPGPMSAATSMTETAWAN
jgi:hypothetical protein